MRSYEGINILAALLKPPDFPLSAPERRLKVKSKVSMVWKAILGLALLVGGGFLAAPQLGEYQLTGAAVMGIALIALGASVLAGVFD